MDKLVRGRRDLAVPVEALSGVREALRTEVGPLTTVHALHGAGYAAGRALFHALAEGAEGDPGEVDEGIFWGRLSDFLSRRGWGSLDADTGRPGVGVLTSKNWAEAEGVEEEDQPSCYFSSGLLSGVLSELAGDPIGVLEVECRGSSDDRCRFVFGSEAALHHLYGTLLDGTPLDEAMAQL